MSPDLSIPGDRIRLRSMKEEDLPLKVRWYNDPDIRRTLLVDEQFELEATRQWFEKANDLDTRLDLTIETLEGRPIGLISLLHIDRKNRTAEIIIVIGEKEYWGRGVMVEAETLLIDWAFRQLALEKIWAVTLPENLASLITMKKIGFRIEGTLRQEAVKEGKRIDILRLGLLKEQFRSAGKTGTP